MGNLFVLQNRKPSHLKGQDPSQGLARMEGRPRALEPNKSDPPLALLTVKLFPPNFYGEFVVFVDLIVFSHLY